MNQDSSINDIQAAENITQSMHNVHLPYFLSTSKRKEKTNLILKMNVILSSEDLQNRTNKMKI